MSQRNRLMLLFLAICLAGCGYSTHPLSDEKTNAVDRELLGTWEFVKEPERKDRLHVGLRKGSNAELEVAVVTVKDGRVLVAREPLRTTKIGGEKYLSVPLALDGKENSRLKQVAWLPGRYRVKGDRLVLEFLDLDRTSAAIDAGEIEGQVEEIDISAIVSQAADTLHRWIGLKPKERRDPDAKPKKPIRMPVLTASTAQLRKWISTRGARCFAPLGDDKGTMRRVGSRTDR